MLYIAPHDLRRIFRDRCNEAGGQRAWAKANGFSEVDVSRALSGKRGFSDEMAAALGYEKKVLFSPCH